VNRSPRTALQRSPLRDRTEPTSVETPAPILPPYEPGASGEAAPAPLPRLLAPVPRLGLRTDDAARALGISPRQLERLVERGKGPRFVRAGDTPKSPKVYRVRDLDDWLAANAIDPEDVADFNEHLQETRR